MPTPIIIRDLHEPDKHTNRAPATRGLAFSINNLSPQTTLSNHATTRSGDISTSPRFLGYIFSFFSSAVLLASSVMFYVRGVYPTYFQNLGEVTTRNGINVTKSDLDHLQERFNQMSFTSRLFITSGGIVTQNYQVYGAIAVSALLTAITSFVLFAHLDSFCCPRFFRHFFRDGSLAERNLILTLIIISTISLQICTARFSIGEAQVNVFFSTWTNFISCALNFEVWRNSAGRHSTFQNVLFDRDFPLKRYWFLLSIFTSIVFLSMIDYFLSSYIYAHKIDKECALKLSWSNAWIWFCLIMTTLTWGTFFFNRLVRVNKRWVQHLIELSVSTANVIISGYVIVNLTGGRLDQISCPSNLYFSVWGTFFLSIWVFSGQLETWKKTDM